MFFQSGAMKHAKVQVDTMAIVTDCEYGKTNFWVRFQILKKPKSVNRMHHRTFLRIFVCPIERFRVFSNA